MLNTELCRSLLWDCLCPDHQTQHEYIQLFLLRPDLSAVGVHCKKRWLSNYATQQASSIYYLSKCWYDKTRQFLRQTRLRETFVSLIWFTIYVKNKNVLNNYILCELTFELKILFIHILFKNISVARPCSLAPLQATHMCWILNVIQQIVYDIINVDSGHHEQYGI